MFIYEIRRKNKPKHKYIGQTIGSAQHRWNCHKSWLNNNSHSNSALQNAWNKYGEDAFDFLIKDITTSLDDLNRLEEKYIKEEGYYNIKPGGQNSPHSEETKRKIGKWHKGKIYSKETKLKIALGSRKYKYPKEVVDPNGNIHALDLSIVTFKEFCEKYNLNSNDFRSMMRGERYQHQGWHLPETPKWKTDLNIVKSVTRRTVNYDEVKLKSPSGKIYKIKPTLNEFCRTHNIDSHHLRMFIKGDVKTCKGWILL